MSFFLWLLLGLATSAWSQPAGEASAPGTASAEVQLLAEPPMGDPPGAIEVRQRADALASRLRCPVCQALSVADSNADAAVAMASRIEELVSVGYSDEQIVDYFVGRYGEWVRLEPKPEGIHLLIFVAPVGVVLVGLVMVAGRLRREPADRTPDPQARPEPEPSASAAADPYRQRVLAELAELDRGGR